MPKSKILVCLDTDRQPSLFDSVVAIDAGVEHLLRYGEVTPEQVRDLVYGAMFTRGVDDLHQTAIFIGGRQVSQAEALFAATQECFFAQQRVSVMLDPNGANTTAAAAVLAASRHLPLAQATVAVVAGTGPVGQRVAQLLASEGARVRLGSRSLQRAQQVAAAIRQQHPQADLTATPTGDETGLQQLLEGAQVVLAAGPPGVALLSPRVMSDLGALQVAIDLNAVPPLGIAGIEATDTATPRGKALCYGAIGVGGLKMKLHRAAIAQLFLTNNRLLDTAAIYNLAKDLFE